MMKTIKVDMGLCERLVAHTKRLDGLVEFRFLKLVVAVFSKNSGDVLFKRKNKAMDLDEELKQALINVDKAVLTEITTGGWMLNNEALNIYRDFTTLRTIIS
jgi:hypothetical protein